MAKPDKIGSEYKNLAEISISDTDKIQWFYPLGIYFAADFAHNSNLKCSELQGTEKNTMCEYIRTHPRLFIQIDNVNVLKLNGKLLLKFLTGTW